MYALFAGETRHPGGGMNDFVGMFATIDEAWKAAAQEPETDWWQIAKVENGRLVQVAGAAAVED